LSKLLLDVREAADALSCGRTLVYKLIAGGELRTIKLGRLTRIPQSALDELIARKLWALSDAAGDRPSLGSGAHRERGSR